MSTTNHVGAEQITTRAPLVRRGRGIGAAMAGGNPTRGRSTNDFYATPDETTDALLARWGHHVAGNVWEPCAGNGKLAKRIAVYTATQKRPVNLICTDVAPRPREEWVGGLEVMKLDIFDVKARTDGKRRFDVIITNPPFDIAADIIEHIFTTAEPSVRVVALLLKSTFWHAKKRLPLFRTFPPSVIAPLTWRPDFMDPAFRAANPDVAGPTMELSWNLWIEGNTTTYYDPMTRAGE